jgi:ribulose-phosphate 3-epimerase
VAELAPSIISADFSQLGESLRAVEPFAMSWHVDVMDGHYVPNLTIGTMAMDAIARVSSLPQDVHVMISNVDETWEWYAKAGARRIAFHAEVSADPIALAEKMSAAGVAPGLAINPDVAVSDVERYLPHIAEVVPKIGELKERRADALTVYVDGGVSPDTAEPCVRAGADVLISASAIFGAGDPAAVARDLQRIAKGG